MSPADVLLQQYRALPVLPGSDPKESAAAELAWLSSLAEYLHVSSRRPRFREHAAGWLRDLAPGSESAARRCADEVRSAAVRHAQSLEKLLRTPKGRALLRFLATEDDAAGVLTYKKEVATRYTRAVEQIARGDWLDLAEPDDYLQPVVRWVGCSHPHPRRLREDTYAAPWLNTDAVPLLGDFVAQNTRLRSVQWVGRLSGLRNDLIRWANQRRIKLKLPYVNEDDPLGLVEYFRYTPLPPNPQMEQLDADAPLLTEAVDRLVAVLTDAGLAPLRNAYTVLTQVYAVFHPAPVLDWLGLTDVGLFDGRFTLRSQLWKDENRRPAMHLAATALSTVQQDVASDLPVRSAIEEAIAAGGLVIEVSALRVYWGGHLYAFDWSSHKRPWRLLVALARKARRGLPATEEDVFDEPPGRSAMATAQLRLAKHLPKDLWTAIESVRTPPRSYRLNLPSNRVHVFE